VYTQVPLWVLNEVFTPTIPLDVNKRSGWRDLVKTLFSYREKFNSDSHYLSIPEKGTESIGARIDRLLIRFRINFVPDRSFDIDSRPDDAEPVVPVLVIASVPGLDKMTCLGLFTSEESIQIHFDPSREEFMEFTPIADFYGIEDRTCTICCDRAIDTILIDCCHCATCETCANSFRDGRCPICRKSIKEKIIIPIVPAS
jgi:hypothetical protein